jgi:hypothetical protein
VSSTVAETVLRQPNYDTKNVGGISERPLLGGLRLEIKRKQRATADSARLTDQVAVHESPDGLGCVKTPKLNLRIEISSRLHQFDKQKRWRHCREKTIEKTILRLPHARTFSHSLGPPRRLVRRSEMSAIGGEADVARARPKRR